VRWSKRPSVSFDRAAGYYDATRSLTPEAAAQVTAVLAEALIGHGPVLEIGVGTGRIALPLAEVGLDVVGIDLSLPMLRVMAAKSPAVPAAQADCTGLPFPADSFGAVVASHVFHLVPEWRDATLEALRVLRPDGALLWARGGLGARAEEVAVVFAKAAGIDRTPVGLDQLEGLDAYLRSRGWVGEWLPEVADDRLLSLDDLVDLLESGVMGWTWSASDEERARGAEAARAWAADQSEPSAEPRRVGLGVRFRRYVPLSG
jgi:SAM-dependent methyltransferase